MTDPSAVRRLQEHHEGWAPDQPLPAEPALMSGTRPGACPPPGHSQPGHSQPGHDQLWATLSYAAAVGLWLIPPLAVYLTRGRRSGFVRRHAAQAFSLMLTV